jgi:uncharacterized protein YuzE
MEEDLMEKLKVFYDREKDVLSIAKEGIEEEFVEVYPGINLELDKTGNFIGIEIMRASSILKDVVEPIRKKTHVA